MRVNEGDEIEFTYTDAKGKTEDWTGKVIRADPDKEFFKLATGEAFPRTFRYERIEGTPRVLAHV